MADEPVALPGGLNVLIRDRGDRARAEPPPLPLPESRNDNDPVPPAAPATHARSSAIEDQDHATGDSPPPRRARGAWASGLFATVALAAACIALAAPSLRPVLVAHAPTVLGTDAAGKLTDVLTPENPTDRDVAALIPRVAGLESEMLRLRLDIRQLDRRLIETGSAVRENRTELAGAARAAQDAGQRMTQIEAAGQVLAARVRAAALLAAATRLRRDVDTGSPLSEGVALMDLNGPYPEPIALAVDTLRDLPEGVATIRDLAIAFEALDQSIAATLGQDGSSWSRLRALFGGADDPQASFLQRLRLLAAEGRMAEVATLLTHSPWRGQAETWVKSAGERTEAARAAQAISAYAVTEAHATRQTAGTETR